MSPDDVVAQILRVGVVPVLILDSVDVAVGVCEALLAGGIPIAEVTFRTPGAADAVARIREVLPEMLLGAGTLLTSDDVARAQAAGAAFGVSPGLSEATVEAAQERGLPMFPGVCTPGEVERGLALGLTTLKFFPAEAFGGTRTLTALLGAYRHTGVRFIPTGGLTVANAPAYWAIPEVAAVGATSLAPAELQRDHAWSQITERAAAFAAAYRIARPEAPSATSVFAEESS